MIKVGTKEIKNLPSELTIDEFEDMSRIFGKAELGQVNQYTKVFELLGADSMELKKMTFPEFTKLAKEFNVINNIEKGLAEKIVIDGYTYRAYEEDEDFILMATDLGFCERVVKKRSAVNHWAEIMAILFKREDLGNNEHYSEAHIVQKAKLFREHNIKSDLVIPYIALITVQLAEATEAALMDKVEAIEK